MKKIHRASDAMAPMIISPRPGCRMSTLPSPS
jgi:hypothetical protein